jgi:hypothetical protein
MSSETRGQRVEREVFERLRAALPAEYDVYHHVRWLSRRGPRHEVRDGEADIVIAHAEHGLLVIEVKSGTVSRDADGRWWYAGEPHDRGPFEQAEDGRHALVEKLVSLPDWPPGRRPRAGHAVAFPDVDLPSAGSHPGHLFGPDADLALILDRTRLVDGGLTRSWVEQAFALWNGASRGEGGRVLASTTRDEIGAHGALLVRELLAPTTCLRALLRGDVDASEPKLVDLTATQTRVLDGLRSSRRQEIAGCAGSGKTLLAAEKARRLAIEGFRTLLVCFNRPLARRLSADLAETIESTGRLEVSTFHELCRRLSAETGVLPPMPQPPDRAWFELALPRALDSAIPAMEHRYHAVVVDEGQDFERDWLESLQLLLFDARDVFYVFHDPAQAIYRPDTVAELGLPRFDLVTDCRSSASIHRLVAGLGARLQPDEPRSVALRDDGRPPDLVAAYPGAASVDALRRTLHGLVSVEGLRPWEIAVLTGTSLARSEAWRERRFGNEVLWNGEVNDDGTAVGLPFNAVVDQPADTILCDTIHRSKGLDWPAVVLVELRPDDPRLDQLLYVGASRARQHLVLIAAEPVLLRLG